MLGVQATGAVLLVEDVTMNAGGRRRGRRWFADLKAETLARWVRSASDQRLQSVMRSRLRGVLLWQIFRTIRQRAQPDTRINAVVEFRIAGRRNGGLDRYQVTLTRGRGKTSTRGARRPALTLELEPVPFLRLVGGAASAQRLLITGKLKLRGDHLLARPYPRRSGFPGAARRHRRATAELGSTAASDATACLGTIGTPLPPLPLLLVAASSLATWAPALDGHPRFERRSASVDGEAPHRHPGATRRVHRLELSRACRALRSRSSRGAERLTADLSEPISGGTQAPQKAPQPRNFSQPRAELSATQSNRNAEQRTVSARPGTMQSRLHRFDSGRRL